MPVLLRSTIVRDLLDLMACDVRQATKTLVCGSENKTAIISLYSINWLVFITETEFVYCAI